MDILAFGPTCWLHCILAGAAADAAAAAAAARAAAGARAAAAARTAAARTAAAAAAAAAVAARAAARGVAADLHRSLATVETQNTGRTSSQEGTILHAPGLPIDHLALLRLPPRQPR
mmetsp:Transcript_69271/g.114864  ORF Transcript_69271/g.114864 Transcript_69271/m.114864 type:complete len:117 (-) Transcript_69271:750-1100(-)